MRSVPIAARPDGWISLTTDVVSARILVWAAGWGRDADLTPEAHLYFFDRYERLSAYHRRHGHPGRARALAEKAAAHLAAAGADHPPYAAAMARPRPSHFTVTRAIAGNNNAA